MNAARLLRSAWLLGALALPAAATAQTVGAALDGKIYVEAAFDPATIHVQAQTTFRLRFYQAVSVDAIAIEPPRLRFAELRPIAGDRISEAVRRGMRYRVLERRYAVFPFASGNWSASGAGVTGKVISPEGKTLPLRLDAPMAALAVLPMPAAARPGDWLPARSVSLGEHWQPHPAAARSGQAFRRTLRIEARGVDAAQIPALAISGPGISAHAEPPRLSNRFENDLNVGVREQTWTLIPDGSGTLSVPAIELAWWDGVSGKPNLAVLPGQTLHVAADAAAASAPPAIDASTARISPALSETRVALTTLVALAGGLGLMLGLRWWRQTRPRRALRAACRKNHPRAARTVILEQAKTVFADAPPQSLGELAGKLAGEEVRIALGELDRQLYGSAVPPWQGERLYTALAGTLLFRRRQRGLRVAYARART